ncbi:MAG: shikimate kinase [Pyrinomonadaceae bacterium]
MNRRIVILGFMGCGKTTVGTELARQLKCKFIDLDSFITESGGRSPAEIIEQEGETAFRQIESLALTEVLRDRETRVIAMGGGTWTIPANRTLIALHDCLTVWLDAPFEICWQRIIDSGKANRPLAPDHETARERYQSRRGDYALAEQQVSVNEADSAETIASQLLF